MMDSSIPGCPECGLGMVAIETTAGNWQFLCGSCWSRWGTDWKGIATRKVTGAFNKERSK
jgi:hypothetical protein